MDNQRAEIQEKIRQQFDSGPYPRIPVDESPKEKYNFLYIHNFVTAYYRRNQQVPKFEEITILDAGCGSGYKMLALAEANPGAKVVGIDLSSESIKLAQKRLEHHGIKNTEFHTLSVEDLPKLNQKFDYINCDEVLYLLPDPVSGLKAMKEVLKRHGIIRTNLHSYHQRKNVYRAQELCKMMGLMDANPEELQIEILRETMKSLKKGTLLKTETWDKKPEGDEGTILANHLLVGDKGSTIPEMFATLEATGLEFISMVNWRQWQLMDLFAEPDDLPAFLGMSLPDTSVEERLRMFELLHPIHRLLDFWCGHPHKTQNYLPIEEWSDTHWQQAMVHLHPQLRTEKVREEMNDSVTGVRPFIISQYLPMSGESYLLDSTIAACLLPLLDSAHSIEALAARYQKLRPVNPLTLEPVTEEEAWDTIKQALVPLEKDGHLLIESLV